MLGQMKRQLENSRCFRQGMEKDLEECAEARWLAKPVLDSRALPLLPQTSQQPRIFGHDHDAPASWRKFGEV